MAAVKKRKAKVIRKKTAAKKPAVRKKSSALKKTPARKPAVGRKSTAPKKAPAGKPAAKGAAPKPVVQAATPRPAARPSPKPRPAVAPAQPARGEPLAGEERVGIVTHYFGHLSVAAVRLESGSLRVGDTIRILGHTSDFRQRVDSMQLEHQPVTEAGKRQEIGIKVAEHARENDDVYKVVVPKS
ncbi:MAG: EF-Tu/IF-2/RF-3 family GTPase [Betaproteobacteria bacterium]